MHVFRWSEATPTCIKTSTRRNAKFIFIKIYRNSHKIYIHFLCYICYNKINLKRNNITTVAKTILNIIDENNLTQQAFAKKNVNQSQVSDWISSKSKLIFDAIKDICLYQDKYTYKCL